MDFSEWIGMLQVSNHLPLNGEVADALYDKAVVTKGKTPGTDNQNAQDRLDSQTEGGDYEEIRQHLLDNL
jgi:hypothetical protein